MSAVTLPGSITRLTRSSTLLLPNHALTFVACSDAGPTWDGREAGPPIRWQSWVVAGA